MEIKNSVANVELSETIAQIQVPVRQESINGLAISLPLLLGAGTVFTVLFIWFIKSRF